MITGASTGFGFRSAKQLASQGYHVYASMRQVNGKNAAFAEELRDFVNLFGSVRAARAVLPHMRGAGSGLIVQISSLQGRFILP